VSTDRPRTTGPTAAVRRRREPPSPAELTDPSPTGSAATTSCCPARPRRSVEGPREAFDSLVAGIARTNDRAAREPEGEEHCRPERVGQDRRREASRISPPPAGRARGALAFFFFSLPFIFFFCLSNAASISRVAARCRPRPPIPVAGERRTPAEQRQLASGGRGGGTKRIEARDHALGKRVLPRSPRGAPRCTFAEAHDGQVSGGGEPGAPRARARARRRVRPPNAAES